MIPMTMRIRNPPPPPPSPLNLPSRGILPRNGMFMKKGGERDGGFQICRLYLALFGRRGGGGGGDKVAFAVL